MDHSDHHGVVVRSPGLSLLRMSAVERLIVVGVIASLLWAAVWWALT